MPTPFDSGLVQVPLHGIGSRHDLPLPFSFVVVGAAIALVVSFALLFLAWRRQRFATPGGIGLPRLTALVDHRAFRLVAKVAVLGLYLWVGMALVAGQDLLTNPVFGFVYAWMWVGLVPLSLVLGPFWRVTNPLRTIHGALSRIAGIKDPTSGLLNLPSRIGVWPAAVGLFGFAWLELIQPDRTTLTVLRMWAGAWLVIMIIGAVLFGSRWIAAADPFEAYASTVAELAPLRRVDGEIRWVNPLRGLMAWTPPAGTAAVVCTLLGSTAYDSFINTTWWIVTVQTSAVSPILWGTAGLLAMIIIVGGTFSLASRLMAPWRKDSVRRAGDLPRLMAPTVVPIVVGYAVAHYLSLLVVEGQRTGIHLSDPLGLGWNVFGTAEMGVNTALYDHPTVTAVIQVVAIVGGHVFGIIAAHERSLALLRPQAALKGQLPMLLVMIFYTCAGLLLLFSP
ncbi:MAG: hypothetical protein ACTH2Q_00925 [Propionibacteriaceae bacterium]